MKTDEGSAGAHAGDLTAADQAAIIEARMTDEQRVGLLSTWFSVPDLFGEIPEGWPPAVGYNPGIPELGVPALRETDGPVGVSSTAGFIPNVGTAFPGTLGLASTFDTDLAERVGAAIAQEARAQDFNILLGGGVNLTRDARGGRNFEYVGEDPLLAGEIAGHWIKGVQSQGVISTIKHFAMNDQETLRQTSNSVIDWDEARESDLLAFQKGIEIGGPGSVMSSYNLVNGVEAGGNEILLDQILKDEWGFTGWVMSDWGGVESTFDIVAGQDQQSGWQVDGEHFFGAPLLEAVEDGTIGREEIADAAQRILTAIYEAGADWDPVADTSEPDYDAHAAIALEVAQKGIVLLKNDGALPLAAEAETIVVIGGHADQGVIVGGGSSLVVPESVEVLTFGDGEGFAAQNYYASSPLAALMAERPDAEFIFVDGSDPAAAAEAAAAADLSIVFATKWEGEASESTDISLPDDQDALIEQVADANANTVVVLETGNPVAMPWLDKVRAVVEAWYPGQEGGQAIADVLTGKVNPEGRLPMTFIESLENSPRPDLPGEGLPEDTYFDVNYTEGSDVGYRYYLDHPQEVLFAFGHGLSYTEFAHEKTGATAKKYDQVKVCVTVENTGEREGADAPQAYLVSRDGESLLRLVGYDRVELDAGERDHVGMKVDSRLLAESENGVWVVAPGTYGFAVGKSAMDLGETHEVELAGSYTGIGAIEGDVGRFGGRIAAGHELTNPTGEIGSRATSASVRARCSPSTSRARRTSTSFRSKATCRSSGRSSTSTRSTVSSSARGRLSRSSMSRARPGAISPGCAKAIRSR